MLTRRALREIKLLEHFNGHRNIIRLYDMDIVDYHHFNEIYLYQELMEADLYQVIRSRQPLTDEHYQSFIYQTCCGLKYIHSANVLHRDLKPSNLLVNTRCELKICDFGLARGQVDTGFMTEYVTTRWYRAPEIMLSFKNYTKATIDQLNQILLVLGTPDEGTLNRIGSEQAQVYIEKLEKRDKTPTEQLYPNASSQALDLLEKLLTFDPTSRINAEQALEHPYFEQFHDQDNEPSHSTLFDFSFESLNTIDEMKQEIVKQVKYFKARKHSLKIDMKGFKSTQSHFGNMNEFTSPIEYDVGEFAS
ncbi:hypothetical protein G6F52_007952 [Rhizopus delemar]|nr:hypothetical protein G6F52_007952 [Rhizopus delemar]